MKIKYSGVLKAFPGATGISGTGLGGVRGVSTLKSSLKPFCGFPLVRPFIVPVRLERDMV